MSASQSNVTALYAELNKAIHISDYRQALKSVNKSKSISYQSKNAMNSSNKTTKYCMASLLSCLTFSNKKELRKVSTMFGQVV